MKDFNFEINRKSFFFFFKIDHYLGIRDCRGRVSVVESGSRIRFRPSKASETYALYGAETSSDTMGLRR